MLGGSLDLVRLPRDRGYGIDDIGGMVGSKQTCR